MQITVLDIIPQPPGNVKALISITLDGEFIPEFRIVQQPGQIEWVQLPKKEYSRPKHEQYELRVAVMAAWRTLCEQKGTL